MIEFRLSDYTKSLLAKNKNIKSISKRRAEYYNSREFYDSHPDLMPSDPYIYEGRIITQKEWDKSIKKFERRIDFEIRKDKIKEYIMGIPKKIKNFFKKSDNK